MKVKLLAGVAMAGLFAAGVANAEPNGWYGAIDAGYHAADVEMGGSTLADMDVDDDWAGFARLGYRFTENWRVELEGGYRPGDLGEIVNSAGARSICNAIPAVGACEIPEGDVKSAALMVNVLYDFGTADSPLRPFIGLGAGVNRVNTDILGTFASNRTVAFGADDSSTELAAQAIAGLAFALGDRGHLDLTYRYLMSNMEFDTFVSNALFDQGVREGRYTDHSLTLGLRYTMDD